MLPPRRMMIALVLLFALFISTSTTAQDSNNAQVRFVHTIPGASPVDIYVNNLLTAADLRFGEATDYISISPGSLAIRVTPTGATLPLWEQTLEASSRAAYTLTATTQNNELSFTVYRDDFTALPLGKARFTVIHAIADAPAIDVLLEDGSPALPGVEYARPETTGTLDVQVLPYSMVITPAGTGVGDALASTGVLPLASGTSHILLVYGTLESPLVKLLTAATDPQNGGGFVRLVHGVAEAPPVDVYINDTLAAIVDAPGAERNTTEYIAVPTGTYDVVIRPEGTQQDLIAASITVEDGDYLSAVVLPAEDGVTAILLNDDLDTVTAQQAYIRLINGGADNAVISASLADATFLADNVRGGEASDILAVEPSNQEIVIGVTIDGASNIFSLPAQNFYGGVFYDLLVIGADAIILDPVALAQAPGSAPGAAVTLVEAEPAPAEIEVVVAEPEPEPTVAPAVEVAVQPTAVPQIAPDLPQGRVFNLNPDANLQLRLYPDTQAESLARMPFGTVVTVLGREGELIPNQPATQVPPDYEFIDPVTELEENEDLPRDETWLRVIYTLPEGGTATGWARSDFIDVRGPDGRRLRLRDLDTTPANVPGSVSGAGAGLPTVPQNQVTVQVINLNPDTNLNIRRIPSATGEVLGTMTLGTTADFIGINQAQDWIFVSYFNPQGCTVQGWASSEFLTYRFNDRPVNVQELLDRGLFTTVPETRQVPDPVCTGVPAAQAQPTPIRNAIVAEVALDPGRNLNLRRDPSEASVVLVQVPTGTQLVVNGRSGDANWLQVTYDSPQGVFDGWIAARQPSGTGFSIFVRLTFNGQPFELEEVPLAPGQLETLDVTPTTEAPTG
jgi:uncharacterized protein YraI